MADYTLGLDLGPNSIGWALIATEFKEEHDLDGKLTSRIPINYIGYVDTSEAGHPPLGVRVFEAGLPNYGTSKEKPLSEARRVARSARRVHARRNARKRSMRKLLQDYGFLPKEESAFHSLMRSNPYELRARALDEPLAPHEVGRTLYHMVQRRGFRSNRKETTKSKSDEQGMLKQIDDLSKAIQAAGARTLGEYLYHLGYDDGGKGLRHGALRLRDRHTHRSMYVEELDRILDAQQDAHPHLKNIESRIKHLIFFQHPYEVTEERRQAAPHRANLHRSPQLKRCPLEPTETRCSLRDPLAQEFRILKQLTDLRLREPSESGHDTNGFRELTQAESNIVYDALSQGKTVGFTTLRKKLSKVGTHPEAFFNLERGKREKLVGDQVTYPIAKVVGKRQWDELAESEQQRLRALIVEVESEEDEQHVRREAIALGIDPDRAEQLAALEFNDQAGYLSYSHKALEKLLPHMRHGAGEYEAKQIAYPDRQPDAAWPKLPSLVTPGVPDQFKDITNPVVRRALSEVRKLVNAIIREHGMPKQIVVEMARSMKMTSKKRSEYISSIRKREQEREAAKDAMREMGGNPNDNDQVLKYLLWKEQDCRCIYTGRNISQSDVFSGATDIDHILPRYQSMDNTQENRILCFRDANREKRRRTVPQWLGRESQQFGEILGRLMDICARQPEIAKRTDSIIRKDLPIEERARRVASLPGPWPKRLRRVLKEDLDEEGFTRGQLNDTQYLARVTRNFLELLYQPHERRGDKVVRTTKGGLTAELRRQWGLNLSDVVGTLHTIKGDQAEPKEAAAEEKLRIDHRHHAVDAVVVALSSRASLKRYQDYLLASLEDESPRHEMPWPALREDTMMAVEQVVVSHRPIRRLKGAFHEETFLGNIQQGDKETVMVTRVSLESLSGRQVNAIRDNEIQRLVRERLIQHGWDGKATALPKDWHREPLFMPSGVPVRKCRVLSKEGSDKLAALGDRQHRSARLGKNHGLAVYEDEQGKVSFSVVPTMIAAENIRRRNQPFAAPEIEGNKRVMALCRKDAVYLKLGDGEPIVCVLQQISGSVELDGSLDGVFREHTDSRPAKEGSANPAARLRSRSAWSAAQIQPIEVDLLGRVRKLN